MTRTDSISILPYHLATLYAFLDEKDLAFEWLEKAYEYRDHWLLWLKVDPMLDSLRSDPRYEELRHKIEI